MATCSRRLRAENDDTVASMSACSGDRSVESISEDLISEEFSGNIGGRVGEDFASAFH